MQDAGICSQGALRHEILSTRCIASRSSWVASLRWSPEPCRCYTFRANAGGERGTAGVRSHIGKRVQVVLPT